MFKKWSVMIGGRAGIVTVKISYTHFSHKSVLKLNIVILPSAVMKHYYHFKCDIKYQLLYSC